MRKLLPVLVAIFAAAWFAVPAFATEGPDGHGYIEICKYATGTPTLTGSFDFTVNGSIHTTVAVGQCSNPIEVPSGSATIAEANHPWYEVASVTYLDSDGVTHTLAPKIKDADGIGLWDGLFTVAVPVHYGPVAKETVVNYTDDPVMGNLEICKTAAATSGLTGTFTFAASGDFEDNIAAPDDVSVAVGSCSRPIAVPAGEVLVTENATNEETYVTDISAQPEDALLWAHKWDAEALVAVEPGPTAETMVTFENSQSSLKLCKLWDSETTAPVTPFSFSVSADGGAVSTFSLVADDPANCVMVPLRYRAGSLITITEGTFPGTYVEDITWNGKSFDDEWLADKYGDLLSVDMGARTVTFPVHAGVNDVTFVNDPAPAVPLKICKLGTGLTGSYSFTVAPAGYTYTFVGLKGGLLNPLAPTTVSVPAGQCTIVGWYPYDSTVTITEAAGNLIGVAIDPTSATAVLVGTPNLTTRTASVLLGLYDLIPTGFDANPAIVDFTNAVAPVAPPAATPTPVAVVSPTATTASTSPPTKVVTPAKAMKVASARVVTVGHNRYVVVRVNGPAKMARIHVTLVNTHHQVVSRLTRYVATNHAVRVGNLRLSKSIVSVKVSL